MITSTGRMVRLVFSLKVGRIRHNNKKIEGVHIDAFFYTSYNILTLRYLIMKPL